MLSSYYITKPYHYLPSYENLIELFTSENDENISKIIYFVLKIFMGYKEIIHYFLDESYENNCTNIIRQIYYETQAVNINQWQTLVFLIK